jgi:isochorismate synthase EntC
VDYTPLFIFTPKIKDMKQLIVCGLLLFSACCPSPEKATQQPVKKDTGKQMSVAQYEKNQKTIAMMKEDKKAFACKLNSPELQKRKATVIAQLKSKIVEKVELSNGFSYKFKDTDAAIDLLANFIKTERECCDFFNFNMFVSRDQYILMDISGAEGIKTFIHNEIGL